MVTPQEQAAEAERQRIADETLDEALARLQTDDTWDWLLFGDGSGSNFQRACGWATVSIERVTMDRQPWVGTMNRGTVNFAEMMAYAQPLTYISYREQKRREAGGQRRAIQVHIVTDSQYCVQRGEVSADLMSKNALLWAMISAIKREGIVITWHHTKRDKVALNSFADGLSKVARKLIESYNWTERADGSGLTLYDHNPD